MKLRWKDKIRLNNVIWRCWHMQFMKNEMRPLCAFANPLEIDNHNKIEGTIPLEGSLLHMYNNDINFELALKLDHRQCDWS